MAEAQPGARPAGRFRWLSLLGLEAPLQRLRDTVTETALAAEDRVELLSIEWAEEKQRLRRLLVLAVDAPTVTAEDLAPLLIGGGYYEGLPVPMVVEAGAIPGDAEAGWPLRRFVEHKPGHRWREATVRLPAPPPGEEAQVDFGRMGLIPDEAGRLHKLHVLVVTLSFSRYQFVWPTYRQTTDDRRAVRGPGCGVAVLRRRGATRGPG